jgi:hypothetical protein
MKLLDYFSSDIFFKESFIKHQFGIGIDASEYPKVLMTKRALPKEIKNEYYSYPIKCPCNTIKTKWLDDDGEGNTLLRLIGDGYELRLFHLNREELNQETRAYILNGLPINKGDSIGSIGSNIKYEIYDYSGRNLEYMLLLYPNYFDDDLKEKWGDYWMSDARKELINKYGVMLANDFIYKNIHKINGCMYSCIDKITKKLVYVVDSVDLLNL